MNYLKALTSVTHQSPGEGTHADNSTEKSPLDKGYLEYGCTHYRRRCRIRAPCCNEIFDCRHCHNESKNNPDLDIEGHKLQRHQVGQVICSLCNTEQEVQQVCINCGVCMARYFCGTCKLLDDNTSKKQFHCLGCGVCKVGGEDNFFHCNKCQCCFPIYSKESHICVEEALHRDCPICFESLFESISSVCALRCGHVLHSSCYTEMLKHSRYFCPVCSKSISANPKIWEGRDRMIAATPMPLHLQNNMISILCNDCNSHSAVPHHFLGHKCPHCKSYNTRKT